MIGRALLALTLSGSALLALPAVASAATPAPTAAVGRVGTADLDTFQHRLVVRGWAYAPARSAASIDVRVYVDGLYAGHVRADRVSAGLDRSRHIGGRHNFRLVTAWTRRAGTVTITSTGVAASGSAARLGSAPVRHVTPAPGQRIVIVARRYVGRARYVDGGASPRHGFDCSGYTAYVYAAAKVHALPHNAEAQRHAAGMRRISRAKARPGDLVFYLSGGQAYHVAIYAGHGMQYAAATPRDGVRYQHVWSSAVEYRTDWH